MLMLLPVNDDPREALAPLSDGRWSPFPKDLGLEFDHRRDISCVIIVASGEEWSKKNVSVAALDVISIIY